MFLKERGLATPSKYSKNFDADNQDGTGWPRILCSINGKWKRDAEYKLPIKHALLFPFQTSRDEVPTSQERQIEGRTLIFVQKMIVIPGLIILCFSNAIIFSVAPTIVLILGVLNTPSP